LFSATDSSFSVLGVDLARPGASLGENASL